MSFWECFFWNVSSGTFLPPPSSFLPLRKLKTKDMKTIILDFDGTLGDTRAVIVKTMQQTIAELGLPQRSDAECVATIGLPLNEGFRSLMPMTEEMGHKCADVYRRLFDLNNVPGAVPMFPHVRETIEELYGRGVTLAIASSRGRDTLLGFLRDMKLEQYISRVVAVSDVEHAKPAPDMVLDILRHVGCRADEALVVGDTVFDIEMGRRAGAKTCGVTYGNGTRESLADADFLIDDFGELLLIK